MRGRAGEGSGANSESGSRPTRVTIVTTRTVSDNPRVVKEADALAAAGHLVRVIAFGPATSEGIARDRATMRGRLWSLHTVDVARGRGIQGIRWLARAVQQRVARRLVGLGMREGSLVDVAISRHRSALQRLAAREPADLVIAHHAQALPPAYHAARALSARFGFDAEDLHVDEMPDAPPFALERSIIAAVERRYLPLCDRVTASSPGIATVLADRYRIPQPVTILNAFPSETPPARTEEAGTTRPISLYWFSQVIGLDRGLQDVIRAMPLMQRPSELHLRGQLASGAESALRDLASHLGIASALHFHAPAPPQELVKLAAVHDIGLATEQPVTLNRSLCITNKLMMYFAAGLAVVATDTPGQRLVVERAGKAAGLYAAGDHVALARVLDSLTASRDRLLEAKRLSRELGGSEFSWPRQARRLVTYLSSGTIEGMGESLPVGGAA